MLEALVAARRDESLAEVVSRSLEAEAVALAAMVSEGKESISIDPSLSTDAIVMLCQVLDLGTQLAISVGSRDRPAPASDGWNALLMRIIGAMAASRLDDPSWTLVSGGREPPPPAPLEPYVTVSRHTAPTVRRGVEARRCQ